MKKQKKQDGFSLVELIVAIAIMAIIVLPLLRAFLVSAKTNTKAKERLRATEASQNIMETIEAMSLDDLLTYFSTTPLSIKFGESGRTRLYIDSEGKYRPTNSTEKSADGNYYFGLQGVNGKDVLLKVKANNSILSDGTNLNSQSVAKLTTISSDNDAICYITQSPSPIVLAIDSKDPDNEIIQREIARHIEITISEVTDPDPAIGTYTKVSTNHYYTWWGGTYPASVTDADFSDVVFDNSDNTSRTLKNVYLFYNPWYTSTQGNMTDYITINNTTKQDVNVFIIKQKSDVTTFDSEESYRVRVNVVETMAVGDSTAATKLRTNFDENISFDLTADDDYVVHNLTTTGSNATIALNSVILTGTTNQNKVSHQSLLSESVDNRLFDVTVTTYPSGSFNNESEKGCFGNSEYYMEITGGMVN
jgi:prepilin-type N-terminal cleavage/methylation domain-containing protein